MAVRRAILFIIAFFPVAMLSVVVWAVNRVHPYIGPFPFLLFWILLWVVLTPAFMGVVYVLDKRWHPGRPPVEGPGDASDGGR